MEPQAILAGLARDEGLPVAAILAARERWPEVAPLLIDLVERCAAGDPGADELRPALFVGFHLLGERREQAAYRPLARLLTIAPEDLDTLLGDAAVDTAHRVMAAVFDGDPGPLQGVIETEHAEPIIRARMLEALALLAVGGQLERGAVARYLRDAFMSLRPHREHHVWVGWQGAIAMLGLEELSPLVKKAFARRLIAPSTLSFADFRSVLRYARAHPERPWPLGDQEYAPFADVIEELEGWYAVAEEPDAGADFAAGLEVAEPVINPFRKVGRNDPCPCGSGRKFKRCCLASAGQAWQGGAAGAP